MQGIVGSWGAQPLVSPPWFGIMLQPSRKLEGTVAASPSTYNPLRLYVVRRILPACIACPLNSPTGHGYLLRLCYSASSSTTVELDSNFSWHRPIVLDATSAVTPCLPPSHTSMPSEDLDCFTACEDNPSGKPHPLPVCNKCIK